METEDIIKELAESYPSVPKDTLLELLLVCNGSKSSTESLIIDSLGLPPKKRKLDKPKYQSSISGLFQNLKRGKLSTTAQHAVRPFTNPGSTRQRTQVIQLFDPDDVSEHLAPYASLHRSFLPTELSNNLLKHLMSQTLKLSENEFYLFGQLCKSDHATGVFLDKEVNGKSSSEYVYNGQKVGHHNYTELIKEVSKLAETFVNEKVIPHQETLPFQQVDLERKWKGERCVVNYYENGASHLDWHSDRLSHIGPHSFVISISLGATREFRLRRNYNNRAQTEAEERMPTTIYSILLPHNSMLIMHPGCQEEFKHCVQALNRPFDNNPISGCARFNLTFRYFPPYFYDNCPKCNCGMLMTLRRSFKEAKSRGRYFWTCENTYQNKPCGTFHWADFNNTEGHWVYDENLDSAKVSEWYAPDDLPKIKLKEKEKAEKGLNVESADLLGVDDIYQ